MKPRSANCSFSSNPLTPPTINNMKNTASTLRTLLFATALSLGLCHSQAQQKLNENFESWDGTTTDWLPEGWTEINTNEEQAQMEDGIFTWHVESRRPNTSIPDTPDGKAFAIVYYAYGYDENNKKVDLAQDEWLVSPTFRATETDTLSFLLGYSPLYLFDLNNENINWSDWTFKTKKPSTTLKVMAREVGGEWTELHDLYNEWQESELKELFDNYSSSTYHRLELPLASLSGKEIQVAFRFVGKFGNTMELDAVCVKGTASSGETAVRSLTASQTPQVRMQGESIQIEQYEGKVSIYDASGRQLATGQCKGKLTLAPAATSTSLYVVHLADGRCFKLLR